MSHQVSDTRQLYDPHPPLMHPPPALRCVVLKLASLGMFSFSLGQTVLCIGRNKTSCETYGYNACEYQVATHSSPTKPHLKLGSQVPFSPCSCPISLL